MTLRAEAAPQVVPEVLITAMEATEGDPDGVVLICPYGDCLALDWIRETDEATRWNVVEWEPDSDAIAVHHDGHGDYHHTGYGCGACGRSVSFPTDVAENVEWW